MAGERVRRVAGAHDTGDELGQEQTEANDHQDEQHVAAKADEAPNDLRKTSEAEQIAGFHGGEEHDHGEYQLACQG